MTVHDVYKQGRAEGDALGRLLRHNYAASSQQSYLEDCWEAEYHSRQFSPFEFFARELRLAQLADALWEAYEHGLQQGFEEAWKDRSK